MKEAHARHSRTTKYEYADRLTQEKQSNNSHMKLYCTNMIENKLDCKKNQHVRERSFSSKL